MPAGRAAGLGAGLRQGRHRRAVFGAVRRLRQAVRRGRQGVPETQRHDGRGPQGRSDRPRHRRALPRSGEAPGAGAGGARQGRLPRRVRSHARGARRRRHRDAGEEAHGDLQRGDVDHHHQVSLHRALLDDAAADQRADGRMGREERHQEGLHAGRRLRTRHRFGNGVQEGIHRRRRAGGRFGTHAAPESRVRALRPAHQGRQARRRVRLRSRRRAEHRLHEVVRRARAGPGRHQGDRHRRHHRRSRAERDGRRRAGHDHDLPLLGGARLARERGVSQGLRRGRAQFGPRQLHDRRRLRRHGGDLRGDPEARRQDRRRQGDGRAEEPTRRRARADRS